MATSQWTEVNDPAPSDTAPIVGPALRHLARVRKATFREHIAEALREAILSGELPPGAPLVEVALARQFETSRGPLREALRQLVEEGLVVSVSYARSRVTPLAAEDLHEIESLRVALECFAFEQIWSRRDAAFAQELRARHAALADAIGYRDDVASIDAELALHDWVYEASGHHLLQMSWRRLRGRLQLFWSAAQRHADGVGGPRRDDHDSYVAAALGDDFDALRREIADHVRRGSEINEALLGVS